MYIKMASTKNFFGLEQIEANSVVDPTPIFEEIDKELEKYLLEKSINSDSTDSAFDFLEMLRNRVQKDFDALIAEGTDKKWFIRVLKRFLPCYLTLK